MVNKKVNKVGYASSALLLILLTGPLCTLGQLLSSGSAPPTFSTSNIPGANQTKLLLASFREVTPGAQQFALDLFAELSDQIHGNDMHKDFMISPFAIWSLMLLLVEGASGKTLEQLRTVLHINEDQQNLRLAFSFVEKYLRTKTSTIEVGSLQAIFTNINEPPKREYEEIITRFYGASLIPINFHDPNDTYFRINEEVRRATQGFIEHALLPQDLENARLVMLSSLFFKGQWKHRFNKSMTHSEPFYDEDGNEVGNVDMMEKEANFKYASINELEGHALELPYGKEDRLSMLIVLPKRGVKLNKVVHNLQKIGTAAIFKKLDEKVNGFEDEEVEVHLPKFTTSTDLELPRALYKLGITDIFLSDRADFSLIAPNIFVTKILHSTKIIVDEEGTVAAAVTSTVLANKSTPPKFYLNRPFLYLIVEKSTNVIMFAGEVMNPNNYQYSKGK